MFGLKAFVEAKHAASNRPSVRRDEQLFPTLSLVSYRSKHVVLINYLRTIDEDDPLYVLPRNPSFSGVSESLSHFDRATWRLDSDNSHRRPARAPALAYPTGLIAATLSN